ncbi:uncharacterized protein LOC133203780 [Saccostrea echinata]|uniref:uncharacterized protein LOC133203780 n=1 Tax=Saccostrea echinata TaxID=191078 RepID=UPI002A7F467B|nr:uncharacterized protein LOC133203780 [Saccostrea echinata]
MADTEEDPNSDEGAKMKGCTSTVRFRFEQYLCDDSLIDLCKKFDKITLVVLLNVIGGRGALVEFLKCDLNVAVEERVELIKFIIDTTIITMAAMLFLACMPNNFGCVEKNYRYLRCEWEGISETSCWILSNSRDSNISICDIQRKGEKLFCNISLGNYNQLGLNEFIVINVCNNTEEARTISTTDDKNVQLEPVNNFRSIWASKTIVNLTWTLPISPCAVNDETGGVNCSVLIDITSADLPSKSGWFLPKVPPKSKWTAMSKSGSICTSSASMSLTFENLQPSKSYTAGVKCRPFGSRFWSGVSECNFTTRNSKPQHSPLTDTGSYVLYKCGSYKCLAVYWKTTRYLNEEISGYSVNVSQTSTPNDTMVNCNMAKLSNLPVLPVYTMSVWAWNTAGTSSLSTIEITAKNSDEYKPLFVSSKLVKSYTFEITYSRGAHGPPVDTAVYYWCRGDLHGLVVNCQDTINWKRVKIENDEKHFDTYKYNITTALEEGLQFAVALFNNGSTSGMVWGNTVYLTSKQDSVRNTGDSESTTIAVVISVTVAVMILIALSIWWRSFSLLVLLFVIFSLINDDLTEDYRALMAKNFSVMKSQSFGTVKLVHENHNHFLQLDETRDHECQSTVFVNGISKIKDILHTDTSFHELLLNGASFTRPKNCSQPVYLPASVTSLPFPA